MSIVKRNSGSFQKFSRQVLHCPVVIALVVLYVCSSDMAYAVNTVKASYVTQPTGPNSNFSIMLTMIPSDIDIQGFDLAIGYNGAAGTLQSVTDNTGQPHAAVNYDMSEQFLLSGISYANVYHILIMFTADDLIEPVNLGQLNFKTSADYSDPNNQFCVYVAGYSNIDGVSETYDALIGPTYSQIPTNYESLEPPSSVNDWAIY